MLGAVERGVRIAVCEAAPVRDVRAQLVMQQRRALFHRPLRVDGGLQRLILDLDKVERVLGDIAVLGDDHRHRLADKAHLVDGDRVVGDGDLDDARDRARDRGHLGARDDAGDARQGARLGGIDIHDARMRMRRAQDGGVLEVGHRLHVINELRPPAQERRVLFARDGLADPLIAGRLGRCRSVTCHAENRDKAGLPPTNPGYFMPVRAAPMTWRAPNPRRRLVH